MNQQEIQTLLDLLDLNGCIDDLAPAARSASRGRIDEVVYLHPEGAVRVLEKFISGEIVDRELIEWAEVVHSLDTVGVAEEHEDLMLQFLFEISTPELFHQIDTDTCLTWLARLRRVIT